MEIGYYPGCSLESTSREFDISLRTMCRLMDVALVEIPDWICCGTSPTHVTSQCYLPRSEGVYRERICVVF